MIGASRRSPHQVNAATASNRTALHYACSKNNAAIASLLLKAGANRAQCLLTTRLTPYAATIKANDGASPIHRAASGGNPQLLTMLLESGANVDSQNRAGETALHIRCADTQTNKQTRTHAHARMHAHAHTQPARWSHTMTPHASVMEEHRPLVFLLIEHGASVDLRNSDGKTVDDVASEAMKRALRQALSEAKN